MRIVCLMTARISNFFFDMIYTFLIHKFRHLIVLRKKGKIIQKKKTLYIQCVPKLKYRFNFFWKVVTFLANFIVCYSIYINVSILSKLFCFRNYSFINPPPQFLNSKIFKF